MADYLVFTLTAALGAMGDLAGHERRGTHHWPGRSAVLGLVGAARGIRREDRAGYAALDQLSLAVAVYETGTPLRDFHTIETVPSAAARRPDSRRAALTEAGRRTNTTITRRDYRAGVAYGVALWGGELSRLEAALARPHFTVYLGRKACPLSAPMAPQIVQAAEETAALSQVRLPPWVAANPASPTFIVTETTGPGELRIRQDQPLDRSRWHFGPRRVRIIAGAGA